MDCGRLSNDPLNMFRPSSPTPVTVTLPGKSTFADVIWLRILTWEIILDYPGGPDNHKHPYKRDVGGVRDGGKGHVKQIGLDVAISQGMSAASETG